MKLVSKDGKSETKQKKASVSSVPLFMHIKETIRKQILDGSYSVHSKLPSERELIALFEVSRITVRQALAELQREGLVFKINGKGTFVSKPKAALDVSKLRGFGEAMSSLGYESFARVLSIQEDVTDKDVSSDVTYFEPSLGKKVAAADLESRDIFSILENECGVIIENAKVNIESLLCDAYMSRHLKIEEGGPILHIERKLFNDEQEPVLYENLFYRGDVFRYSLDIDR